MLRADPRHALHVELDPIPLYYDEAKRVLPDRPIGGLGLLQVGAGRDLAFAALTAFTVLAALLNARPPVQAAEP